MEDEKKGYALPKVSDEVEKVEALESAVHIFSHVEWHMKGYHILLKNPTNVVELPQDIVWVEKNQIKNQYSLPVAFHRFRDQVLLNEKPSK